MIRYVVFRWLIWSSAHDSVRIQLQSINVVEKKELRAIFLLLRDSLEDSDIPHRTKIRKEVIEAWKQAVEKLRKEMSVSGCDNCSVVTMAVTNPNAFLCLLTMRHLLSRLVLVASLSLLTSGQIQT